MAKILLNNPDNFNNPPKTTPPVEETKQEVKQVVNTGNVTTPVTKTVTSITTTATVTVTKPAEDEDDFAIFPEWDVVPPSSIINPRIKRKL